MSRDWTRLSETPHRFRISGDTVYLWCSGTYSWARWAWNFSVIPTSAFGRKINRRDYIEAEHVVESMLAHIDAPEKYKYVCLGYSLGGALAAIANLKLKAFGVETSIRTWAPKRTMSNIDGLNIEECTAYRGDPVPFLPPMYARWPVAWRGSPAWPWQAHLSAKKDAARARHDIGKQ